MNESLCVLQLFIYSIHAHSVYSTAPKNISQIISALFARSNHNFSCFVKKSLTSLVAHYCSNEWTFDQSKKTFVCLRQPAALWFYVLFSSRPKWKYIIWKENTKKNGGPTDYLGQMKGKCEMFICCQQSGLIMASNWINVCGWTLCRDLRLGWSIFRH